MTGQGSPRNDVSLVCIQGRHVVDELIDVLVADPNGLVDLGLQRVCRGHVASLRADGLVLEEVV